MGCMCSESPDITGISVFQFCPDHLIFRESLFFVFMGNVFISELPYNIFMEQSLPCMRHGGEISKFPNKACCKLCNIEKGLKAVML